MKESHMYITNFTCSIDPFNPNSAKSFSFNLHEILQMQLTKQDELVGLIKSIEQACDLSLDWKTLVHDSECRLGSIDFRLAGSQQDTISHCMSWGHSPLDDPDFAEFIDMPVNHRKEIIGVLTPAQIEKFWKSVNSTYEPLNVLTDLLRRFHLTPADLDEFDIIVTRQVIAIQWWRAFPSVAAGEAALDLEPDLTAHVDALVTQMAAQCYLRGDLYELYGVFVE